MTLEDKEKNREEVLSYRCVLLPCEIWPVEQLLALSCFALSPVPPGPALTRWPELSGVFLTVRPPASRPATEKGPFD